MKVTKKVKSIQMFRKPVTKIIQVIFAQTEMDVTLWFLWFATVEFLGVSFQWVVCLSFQLPGRQSWSLCHAVWPQAARTRRRLLSWCLADNICSNYFCEENSTLQRCSKDQSKVPHHGRPRDCDGKSHFLWFVRGKSRNTWYHHR